jgi:hypothetical protein
MGETALSVLKLAAGTDVAEMALFDVDAIQDLDKLDSEAIDRIAKADRLIRFQTGGDGGYLLHLFLNESVPAEIKKFCVDDDVKKGTYKQFGTSIAFGGLESAHKTFMHNQFIRSDSSFSPGEYKFTAYRTEIPDDIVTAKIESILSQNEKLLMKVPVAIVLCAIILAMVAIGFGRPLIAAILVLTAYLLVRKVTKSLVYKQVKRKLREAQIDFPSMVIEMWSV